MKKKKIENSRSIVIFQKMKNCNFSQVFFFQLFIVFLFFYHILSFLLPSSFLLPMVQKFSKKWKIAIFLEFFLFLLFFIIF